MTHAFAVGLPSPQSGTQQLPCSICGDLTNVAQEDEDAVWVVCPPCRNAEETKGHVYDGRSKWREDP